MTVFYCEFSFKPDSVRRKAIHTHGNTSGLNPLTMVSAPEPRWGRASRPSLYRAPHLPSPTCIKKFTSMSTECTSENNPLEKILYFSNGSTNFSQTVRLCMSVFTQHRPILQISFKQLIRFNKYSSLNFNVHFFQVKHVVVHWKCCEIILLPCQ